MGTLIWLCSLTCALSVNHLQNFPLPSVLMGLFSHVKLHCIVEKCHSHVEGTSCPLSVCHIFTCWYTHTLWNHSPSSLTTQLLYLHNASKLSALSLSLNLQFPTTISTVISSCSHTQIQHTLSSHLTTTPLNIWNTMDSLRLKFSAAEDDVSWVCFALDHADLLQQMQIH